MKFVSDLRQVGGFLRVIQFPLPKKLTATIYPKKTTDLSQVIDKFYHIMLYTSP